MFHTTEILDNIKIKRIRSAKHLRLRILPSGQLVLTCHPFTPQRAINNFIAEHQEWIADKLSQVTAKQTALTANPKTLLLHGKELELRIQVKSGRSTIKIDANKILVTNTSEDHSEIRTILEKWYKSQARKHFESRVPLLCDVADQDIMRVTIRSQRTRWGSCSSRQTISLNWRLIMAPDWVSDYVIYHEVAHLTHMNHSNRFWQLVEEYFPRYKEAEAWLKRHHELLQF